MTCIEPAFRTSFQIARQAPIAGPIVLLGSCFTDEIGSRLERGGYDAVANPCGVLYNPLSIAQVIEAALAGEMPADSYFEHGGLWRCWLLAGQFAAGTLQECKQKCEGALARLREGLRRADTLFVTFGTAWIYEHMAPGFCGTVGNCHKVPAAEFSRRRISVAEIAACWGKLLENLPGLRVIFTVSPIRHFKDGAHENTLSKATLHLGIEAMGGEYFPAWELLMDDLRDYRFYAEDMLHPSSVAAEYIYGRFCATYFDAKTIERLNAGERAWRRGAHRPLLDR